MAGFGLGDHPKAHGEQYERGDQRYEPLEELSLLAAQEDEAVHRKPSEESCGECQNPPRVEISGGIRAAELPHTREECPHEERRLETLSHEDRGTREGR